MDTAQVLKMIAEGWTMEVGEPKEVIEGDRERPVTVTVPQAFMVSPHVVPDMYQNEEKERPAVRREMDGTPKTTKVRLPIPPATFNGLDKRIVEQFAGNVEVGA